MVFVVTLDRCVRGVYSRSVVLHGPIDVDHANYEHGLRLVGQRLEKCVGLAALGRRDDHPRISVEVAHVRFCLSQPAREASTFTRRHGQGSGSRWRVGSTVHGFRSSFRDWCGNETHFPREVAEAALAHVVGDKAEQSYRRIDALEKRRALMEA